MIDGTDYGLGFGIGASEGFNSSFTQDRWQFQDNLSWVKGKHTFKVGGGKSVDKFAKDAFAAYLRAMETVTMYDRDETERTWADQD